ncbi:uncharacterized protein SPAPADRAFT_71664 [Spathaspora passalidarum NRRL Y-27907]|uniref:Pre-mRNA-splicing factor CWC25 n=1 Tax=Spathaspora passalidarum (strain NRRL Y-27907 / 11-Y1) TaxID=619300 RepID=G3APK7_SPAPN|nr:uncharacterized protein SPAPADRAFT_71664 [Spathaspora passalidarum NRRL Y-27907]EGW32178.1 hypothetical protein SPAPADRAFT_71664 [Spathaspora passalidarum NRRL Y-27907]
MAGDLNLKKSWNPALVKNQKKVWDQEQAKLQELQKIKQKNQEYEQEQDYLNLLKLQYGDNFKLEDLKKPERLKLSKLNWMYEDVPFEEKEEEVKNDAGFIESSNEFTEGKSKVENLLKGNHSFKRTIQSSSSDRLNKVIGVGISKPSGSSDLSDDPLLRIKQQQQLQRMNQKKHDDKSKNLDHHSSRKHSDSHRHRHRSDHRDSERYRSSRDIDTERGHKRHRTEKDSYRPSSSHRPTNYNRDKSPMR